jgi:hypothetical protein
MTAPRPSHRLLRGYGPLAAFVAVFVAISMFVPTVRTEIRTEPASSGTGSELAGTDGTGAVDEAAVEGATEEGGAAAVGAEGTAGAAGGSGGKSGAKSGRGGSTSGGGAGGGASGPPGIAPCKGRAKQDPSDPYSPPCLTFSGNNGGATSKGVTGNAINISVRIQAFDNGVLDALSRVAGANIPNESRQKIANTVTALVEYINRVYQFYGRKLDLKMYTGQGEVEREILGGGQEGAEGDALKAAEELEAFADASAVTPPYADALARRKVISTGAPYMSREWLSQRRPYVWSQLTDCSTVVEAAASYYVAKLGGKPAAYAGGSLNGKPRRAAIIAPDNSWYQQCAKAGRRIVEQAGHGSEVAMELPYRLDINSMAPQATTMISKLKSANITTIVCGCDPLILTFLTGKAREQGYQPEWMETGVAFTDQDLVGQIFDQQVWNKAFGVSFAGPTQPLQAGMGYRAFKAIRPNEEPSIAADVIYYQLQMLAIGIQMAGPNLTPETFEQGMFRYPQTTGPLGTWKFGPGDYTTSQDAREVYWDANAISPQNDKRGGWIDPNRGARYPIGRFPAGEPNVPR